MSVSISYSFSPTTTIASAQVNQNFTDLVNYFNNTSCVTNMVVGWKGAIVDIPTGWTLDNDLKDKFIVGAGNSYAVGASGGANTKDLSHTHTGPSHQHKAYGDGGDLRAAIGRNNSANDDIAFAHVSAANPVGGGASPLGASTAIDGSALTPGSITNFVPVYGYVSSAGTGATGSGGSSTQDIRPPYYSLAWLRKT